MEGKTIPPTPSAYNYPLLIKSLLSTPLIYAPDQEIVYRDHMRYTYANMGRRVEKLANALSRLGVESGDTVAVMEWDSHRYLECFFAVPMMGAVLHTINIRLTPEQLIHTINHAEDDVILVYEEFLPMLKAVRDQLTSVKKIILLSDSGGLPETDLKIDAEYEEMLSQAPEGFQFPELDENTVATIFYTTGTTGLPKGVYFTHRQLVLQTHALMFVLSAFHSQSDVTSADTYMPLTPMFHVHAWGVPYLMTALGAKQVYPGRYEPEMLLNLIKREKVTFSHCVPTILHMLLSCKESEQVDLSGWKLVIGGSSLPKGLCREAMEAGINVYTGYGMSETCPLISIVNLKQDMLAWSKEEQVNIRCSAGLPGLHVQAEIMDLNGNFLPHDGVSTGEIVVRAPWLTQGYLKDSEKSEGLWADGWLHTGDIGFINKQGYLQITDRLKDVIKTGGEWVSSLELESIISQHPDVSEVAVIGVFDRKWGERPMALVVPKSHTGVNNMAEEIKSFCSRFVEKGEIPKYGIPNQVFVVEEIAKTSVGKIDKKELRSRYCG